jgi:tripartite-type tricarboxylate transporter receptor subunit TctC
MNRSMLSLATLSLFLLLPNTLRARGYPKQPINLIIPLAPGDATDVAGRTIGEGLSKLLKVPVVAAPSAPTARSKRRRMVTRY